jgi:RNase H-like domain found in reverse transcriptase
MAQAQTLHKLEFNNTALQNQHIGDKNSRYVYQYGNESETNIIKFFFKLINIAKKTYNTIRLEFFEIVKILNSKRYLFHPAKKEIIVETNHKNLTMYEALKIQHSRHLKWYKKITEV